MTFIKKHKIVLFLILTVIGVVFFGQKLLNTDSSTTSTTSTVIETVKKGNISSSVVASGQIQTANYLAVTTSANGIVKKVFVKEGDKVVKGQKIMEITLDTEGENALSSAYGTYLRSKNSLESAKNSLRSADTALIQASDSFENEKEINSYQSHDERSAYKIAENAYEKARVDYELKKSEITQLEISLNSSWIAYQSQSPVITAPSDGVIANIVAVEGIKIENSVSERSVKTLASIRKEGTPIASVDITELDINSISVGQKVNLKLNSQPDQKFEGVVLGIDKMGSVQSGVSNYPVIIKFTSDNVSVLPNMNVEAEIILAEKTDVLYIPTSAIKTRDNKKTVQLNRDGTTFTVEINVGISNNTSTEVISGLNEGDEILLETLPTSGFTTTTQQRSSGVMIPGISSFQQRR